MEEKYFKFSEAHCKKICRAFLREIRLKEIENQFLDKVLKNTEKKI